ncbi:MAG: sigma 54-interacting transcriptional regulator [Deltaproteobacteria bacterium]|nr:sigma 54-interacting transcriptional regulator [Deltaproteobacteria bacterium]
MLEDDPTAEPATVAGPIATTATLRLVWSGEHARLQDFPVEARCAAGRSASGADDIKLEADARVSRQHAVLVVEKGRLRLENLSQRGCFVNGTLVEGACTLYDGDVVRMGDSFLVARHLPDNLRDVELSGILGRSPSIVQLRGLLRVVGPTKASVMLLGETGSGKEVAARALHEESGRRGPFVAVNCAAIPENLAESQLFGHKAGSFTGAQKDHAGYFRQADGGTLFLDEVGELPLTLQPKLLRVLDEGQVFAVGATVGVPVDVRVVAATNRHIAKEVEQGAFRGDVFARLAEITISLPPLRARKEDVLLLLTRALPDGVTLSAALVNALLLHDWPFNVRELMKIATELEVKAQGRKLLDVDLLEGRVLGPRPSGAAAPGSTTELPRTGTPRTATPPPRLASPKREEPAPTKEELERLLAAHHGKVSDVARATGRSRTQVYRWLEQHRFDLKQFRG